MSSLSNDGKPGVGIELNAEHGPAAVDVVSDASPARTDEDLNAKLATFDASIDPALALEYSDTHDTPFNMSIRFKDATFTNISSDRRLGPAFALLEPLLLTCSVIIVQGLVRIDKLLAKPWLVGTARAQLVNLGLACLRLWRTMALHETSTGSRDRPGTAISILLHTNAEMMSSVVPVILASSNSALSTRLTAQRRAWLAVPSSVRSILATNTTLKRVVKPTNRTRRLVAAGPAAMHSFVESRLGNVLFSQAIDTFNADIVEHFTHMSQDPPDLDQLVLIRPFLVGFDNPLLPSHSLTEAQHSLARLAAMSRDLNHLANTPTQVHRWANESAHLINFIARSLHRNGGVLTRTSAISTLHASFLAAIRLGETKPAAAIGELLVVALRSEYARNPSQSNLINLCHTLAALSHVLFFAPQDRSLAGRTWFEPEFEEEASYHPSVEHYRTDEAISSAEEAIELVRPAFEVQKEAFLVPFALLKSSLGKWVLRWAEMCGWSPDMFYALRKADHVLYDAVTLLRQALESDSNNIHVKDALARSLTSWCSVRGRLLLDELPQLIKYHKVHPHRNCSSSAGSSPESTHCYCKDCINTSEGLRLYTHDLLREYIAYQPRNNGLDDSDRDKLQRCSAQAVSLLRDRLEAEPFAHAKTFGNAMNHYITYHKPLSEHELVLRREMLDAYRGATPSGDPDRYGAEIRALQEEIDNLTRRKRRAG